MTVTGRKCAVLIFNTKHSFIKKKINKNWALYVVISFMYVYHVYIHVWLHVHLCMKTWLRKSVFICTKWATCIRLDFMIPISSITTNDPKREKSTKRKMREWSEKKKKDWHCFVFIVCLHFTLEMHYFHPRYNNYTKVKFCLIQASRHIQI